jgi:hypothetical protein
MWPGAEPAGELSTVTEEERLQQVIDELRRLGEQCLPTSNQELVTVERRARWPRRR